MRAFVYIVLFFTALLMPAKAKSQDATYQTYTGKIVAVGELKGSLVSLHSKNATVFLDYDRARFHINIPLNSVHTDIDSLSRAFDNSKKAFLTIDGKMAIESINTSQHDPLYFEIKGDIEYKEMSSSFVGSGQLEHLYGSEHAACLLGLNFEIDPSAGFLPESYAEVLEKSIKVQLLQTVLERNKHSEY